VELTQVLSIGQDLFWTMMLLSLPALLISLVVGLIVSILQAVTSIQEQTLSFTPRLIAVGLVIIFTLGWLLQNSVHFTIRMLEAALEATR
jgi:flagellar biosynthetic protein FliQ